MRIAVLVLVALVALAAAAAAEIVGHAIVRDDGSLVVGGRILRLHGLYIPPSRTDCATWIIPARCLPQGALALERRIQGFVRCREVGRNADDSIAAVCYVPDEFRFGAEEDLGQWLIAQGWALALPDAPFAYLAAERLAQVQRQGLWGEGFGGYGYPYGYLWRRF